MECFIAIMKEWFATKKILRGLLEQRIFVRMPKRKSLSKINEIDSETIN